MPPTITLRNFLVVKLRSPNCDFFVKWMAGLATQRCNPNIQNLATKLIRSLLDYLATDLVSQYMLCDEMVLLLPISRDVLVCRADMLCLCVSCLASRVGATKSAGGVCHLACRILLSDSGSLTMVVLR